MRNHSRLIIGLIANLLAIVGALFVATPLVHGEEPPKLMIAVDVSGSMVNDRIDAAKAALTGLVDGSDPQIAIGLVKFNSKAGLLTEPTTDKVKLLRLINRLEVNGKTALYDALALSIEQLQAGDAVIVLCDGEDNSSAISRKEVLALALAKGVTVNAVAIEPRQAQRDNLASLTKSTGGRLFAVTQLDELLKAFLTFQNPTPTPEPSTPGQDDPDNAEIPGLGLAPALFAAAAVLLVATGMRLVGQTRRRKRIAEYFRFDRSVRRVAAQTGSWLRSHAIRARLRARITAWMERLGNHLDDVGISESAREWLTRQATTAAIFFVILILITGNPVAASFLAIVGGIQWARMSLSRSKRRMMMAFEEELHGTLLVAASSLRAGLSLVQALESIAREGQGEVARQFKRAVSEVQVGSTIEDALYRVADRVESEDLRWVVLAMAIQREVGGSLSHILVSTADMVAERFALRREVRTLSAEGRLSAQVLVAMPILIFLLFFTTRKEYVAAFWSSITGFFMLFVVVALEVLGWLWIRKVVQVKV